MKNNRSVIKYYAVSLLSLISAVVLLGIRISSYVKSIQGYSYSYNSGKEIAAYVCLNLVIILAVVAASSACLIMKTEKEKRIAALASTLFAPIVSNAPDWNLTISRASIRLKDWTWAVIVWSFICIACFVVTVLMATVDDRKEKAQPQRQAKTESDVREKESVALATDAVDRLFQLKQLLDAGILSEKEYEEKKTQYVNKL